jgi:hypothetical protein
LDFIGLKPRDLNILAWKDADGQFSNAACHARAAPVCFHLPDFNQIDTLGAVPASHSETQWK